MELKNEPQFIVSEFSQGFFGKDMMSVPSIWRRPSEKNYQGS